MEWETGFIPVFLPDREIRQVSNLNLVFAFYICLNSDLYLNSKILNCLDNSRHVRILEIIKLVRTCWLRLLIGQMRYPYEPYEASGTVLVMTNIELTQ